MFTIRRKAARIAPAVLVAALGTACASSPGEPSTGGSSMAMTGESMAELHAAMGPTAVAAARMMEGPSVALMHWEMLGLSVDQLRRIEDLEYGLAREREALAAEMEAARGELDDASAGGLDEPRARAALNAYAELRTEAALVTLRAREATLALLTDEQAETLAAIAHEHMHMVMMGGGSAMCTGADALVSDATGMMVPCLVSPEPGAGDAQDGGPMPVHVHGP